MFGSTRRLRPWVAVAALPLVVSLAACNGGSSDASSGGSGGAIHYALPPNATPNWILPISGPENLATYNSAIKQTLWTPLFNVNGAGQDVGWDKKGSLAKSVTFGDDGRKATITLKDMHWNDGKPVTTRDVQFWFNLVKANKKRWGNYAKGRMPDNVAKFEAKGDKSFTLTFDKKYNQDWLLFNQLTMLTAMPQHAWDKTSDDGKVGNYDRTHDGAVKVWKYLTGEAKHVQSYDSNPLWQVVNGPYTVKEWTSTGQVTLVKNKKYDGDDPAHSKVILQPFTSAQAELNALRSKQVDYGYLPARSIKQKSQFTSLGYQIDPWEGYAITYMPYNFNNPKMGAVLTQLYARQAIQHSIDQKSIAKVVWNGTADPTFGPVPNSAQSKFISKAQQSNPYPFDVDKAKKILTTHGWKKGSDGVMQCVRPGSGADQCGPGVDKGTRFAVTVLSQSGSKATDDMMATIKSDLGKAGIEFNIKSAPLNQVLDQSGPCKPDEASCDWQLSFFGTQGSWYFAAYPSGGRLFGTSGTANFGHYSNEKVDQAIQDSLQPNSPKAMQRYSELLAKDLPVVWLPEPAYQISAIKKGLDVGGQDPLAEFFPQRWHWTS